MENQNSQMKNNSGGAYRLEEAIELLNTKQSTGSVLGKDEKSGNEIELKRGRFGFYVTDGKINASLKSGEDMEITTYLEKAMDTLIISSGEPSFGDLSFLQFIDNGLAYFEVNGFPATRLYPFVSMRNLERINMSS